MQIGGRIPVLATERVPEAPLLEVLAAVLAADVHRIVEVPCACTGDPGGDRLDHHVAGPDAVGELADVGLAVDECARAGTRAWIDERCQ